MSMCPSSEDTLSKALFDQLVADSDERALPSLTVRRTSLPWLDGKADVVTGMRRVGKTYFTFQILEQRLAEKKPRASLLYVNFDDERLSDLRAAELGGLVDAFYRRAPAMRDVECTFVFDEIQVVPGWERFARRLIDSENLHLVLTGSSAKLLSKEIATSMRGRALTTELFPFSFGEALAYAGVDVPPTRPGKKQRSVIEHRFDMYLVAGGFPEAQRLDAHKRTQLLQEYLDVVILRDVVERHAVSNPVALRRFIRQLMNAPGGLVSIHRIYNDLRSQGASVSKDTLHEFLDHLVDAYLFLGVPIRTDSERVRQSNPRKIYAIDPGLANACTRRLTPDVGHLLETFVFLELRRRHDDITYMRTREGFEGDFVVEERGARPALFQACADMSDPETRARELRATESCMNALPVKEATIVTLREEGTERLGNKSVRLVPAWLWALERGRG